jgi:hypothetical protein
MLVTSRRVTQRDSLKQTWRRKVNILSPELNPSAQRYLPRFFLGILLFKELAA